MLPAISRLSITFGLVTIPVTIHSVIEEQSVPLHQVHAEDGGRIRLRRGVRSAVRRSRCSSWPAAIPTLKAGPSC